MLNIAKSGLQILTVNGSDYKSEPAGIRETGAFVGGNISDPNRSNGIIYVGFGPLKMGWDSEGIRNVFQNRFAHDYLTGGNNGSKYPYVLPLKRDPRFVFQFGGF